MKEGKCKVDLLYEVVVLALLARLNDFTLESPKFGERRADRRGGYHGSGFGLVGFGTLHFLPIAGPICRAP